MRTLGQGIVATLLVAASCAPLAAQSAFLPIANPFARPASGPATPPLPAISGPAAGGSPAAAPSAPAANAPGAAAPAPAVEPMATRSYRFTIPYTLTPPKDPADAPAQVQLHVSKDRGASWAIHTTVPATQPNFSYEAPGDGEYWFMSKTVDRGGRVKPAAGYRAELKVIVDTKAPRLNLNVTSSPGGEVAAQWEAFDDMLDPQSLQISYQPGPKDTWQPVAVELPPGGAPRTSISGNTPFLPQTGNDAITVRAEIKDKAGNPTVVHRQVTLTRVAGRPNVTVPTPPQQAFPPGPVAAAPAPWPGSTERPRNDGWVPAANGWSSPDRLANGPAAAPIQPPVASQVPGPGSPPGYAPVYPTAGMRPRMTTFRRFNLPYEVEAVGPLGVAKVELWGTRDNGQTWENWGIDPDKMSPFPVEVDREGTYGFRIVVAGNNGLVGDTPRSGDPADVSICIDWSKPVGRITGAQYGQGANAGALEIQWEAADPQQNLGDKPITLKFGESPNGPWNTIAAGLPNNGAYLWRVDARVPPHIFLKLEVRDEAGNVGGQELTEPISTRALLPKAKILDIQPSTIEGTPGALRLKTVR